MDTACGPLGGWVGNAPGPQSEAPRTPSAKEALKASTCVRLLCTHVVSPLFPKAPFASRCVRKGESSEQ